MIPQSQQDLREDARTKLYKIKTHLDALALMHKNSFDFSYNNYCFIKNKNDEAQKIADESELIYEFTRDNLLSLSKKVNDICNLLEV